MMVNEEGQKRRKCETDERVRHNIGLRQPNNRGSAGGYGEILTGCVFCIPEKEVSRWVVNLQSGESTA